jgi:hypothetical protein
MDLEHLEKIKRLVVIAMFSDDELMDRLVLKGGNALDIVHKVAERASVDLDFSIENEFDEKELEIIEQKIQKVLTETFKAQDYDVFDLTFVKRPQKISPDMQDFWGGYQVEFKIINTEKHKQLGEKIDSLRRQATVVGGGQKRKIKIDISKFEYCKTKQESELEGYTIYVYTPEMIALEKLRAICQQMPEYGAAVKDPSRSARPRDFFDIYTVIEHFRIDLGTTKNINLLRNIFAAKRVPLKLIGKIEEYREFHRAGFAALRDTVRTDTKLNDFDFYFDYVVGKCRTLKALWEV